jgi:L-fucose isomerase-like protein
MNKKSTFALFFGSRGTFPEKLIAQARSEMSKTLKQLGHKTLLLDAKATGLGAVESPAEGKIYAEFLRENRGKVQGVILCLPNFGSEGGVVAALKDVDVPVLVHAYPDELDKMATATRRDAFCGKFAVLNILRQYGIKFTNLEPHAVHPHEPEFAQNIAHFDRVCRTVSALKNLTVGAIGARTTPFKAVRYDEIALQQHGITVETLDLSDVFKRVEKTDAKSKAVLAKIKRLKNYVCWDGVPDQAVVNIARLGVVLDGIVEEYSLHAMALRCWIEIQQQLGISPCVLVSEMNDRGAACACEVDVSSAVAMSAIQAASDGVATNLDWNNNYGNEKEKCILFHCGPVPQSLMAAKGQVTDHELLWSALGKGCSWGCNTGRIKPMEMTFCGMQTRNGQLQFYIGEGRFTEDKIPNDFFGCAGVAEIPGLQTVLRTIGSQGHRHHTCIVEGHVAAAVAEALEVYLNCEVTRV